MLRYVLIALVCASAWPSAANASGWLHMDRAERAAIWATHGGQIVRCDRRSAHLVSCRVQMPAQAPGEFIVVRPYLKRNGRVKVLSDWKMKAGRIKLFITPELVTGIESTVPKGARTR